MTVSRRDFLKRGAIMSAIGIGAPTFLVKGAAALQGRDAIASAHAATAVNSGAAAAQAAGQQAVSDHAIGKRILVVVQFTGGNDGLNTVIPYSDPAFYQVRQTLAVPQTQVLDLDGKVGLSPSLRNLKRLYQGGNVAVIQGVGYPNPNRSHFRSMEIWQTAAPEKAGGTASGWLGRYLDASAADDQAARDAAFRAANIGSQLPRTFWDSTTLVPSIASLNSYAFQTDTRYPKDQSAQLDVIEQICDAASQHGEYEDYIRRAALDALGSSATLKKIVSNYQVKGDYGTAAAKNPFSDGLKMVAQMIGSGLETQIYYITSGGFDTHANEKTVHDLLMKNFDDAVNAFFIDLEAAGRTDDVLLMTFSEFGRRVKENGSGGTDHGTALPMFLISGGIRGGVYGNHPSLTDLDNGDLKFNIDFRAVYGSVLRNWLGADPSLVVGDGYPNLAFLKS